MQSNIGKVVTICGLKARSDLNGEKGDVQEELSNGGLKVSIRGPSNVSISISRENVVFENNCEEPNDVADVTAAPAINPTLKVWMNSVYFYPCKYAISISDLSAVIVFQIILDTMIYVKFNMSLHSFRC